jgi:hypothetical protein
MKTAFLILTSSLVIAGSGAFAQQGGSDACHNQYGSCMERCATRPQGLQESCSNTCEATTNQCYAGMYSAKPGAASIQSAPDQGSADEARDARNAAKTEAKARTKKK